MVNEPIENLIRVKTEGFDRTDATHWSVVAKAMLTLSYCSDTLTQILEVIGQRPITGHNDTFDAISRPEDR